MLRLNIDLEAYIYYIFTDNLFTLANLFVIVLNYEAVTISVDDLSYNFLIKEIKKHLLY